MTAEASTDNVIRVDSEVVIVTRAADKKDSLAQFPITDDKLKATSDAGKPVPEMSTICPLDAGMICGLYEVIESVTAALNSREATSTKADELASTRPHSMSVSPANDDNASTFTVTDVEDAVFESTETSHNEVTIPSQVSTTAKVGKLMVGKFKPETSTNWVEPDVNAVGEAPLNDAM